MSIGNLVAKFPSELGTAKRRSRRSYAALLAEIVWLRFAQGRMGFSEYFDFRLYENDLSPPEKRAFLGRRGQRVLHELVSDEFSLFLHFDKLTMSLVLNSLGLPMPPFLALFSRRHRPCHVPVLGSASELGQFLQSTVDYPLYMKRCHGNYGRGNRSIAAFKGGAVELSDGEKTPLDAFVASLRDPSELGWTIQKTLFPHRAIRERCGDKISGIRFYTFLSARGPLVHRAVWKINVGTKDSDNFAHGTSGNMLGAVDLASGRVTRVVAGVGQEQRENPLHPVTGKPLVGFVLPHWEAAKALVLRASGAFPGFMAQGWDVAVCEEGPILLEVNCVGDVDLSQHAHRSGFLDADYIAYLEERGIAHLLRGPSQPWRAVRAGARRGRRSQHWKWW